MKCQSPFILLLTQAKVGLNFWGTDLSAAKNRIETTMRCVLVCVCAFPVSWCVCRILACVRACACPCAKEICEEDTETGGRKQMRKDREKERRRRRRDRNRINWNISLSDACQRAIEASISGCTFNAYTYELYITNRAQRLKLHSHERPV